MRFLGFICGINVALDCAVNATEPDTQNFFAHDMAWLWWPGAALWFCIAIAFFFWNPKAA